MTAEGRVIEYMYTCKACGVTKQRVEVAPRRPGQDVRAWVELVGVSVSFDHGFRSPACGCKVADIYIPAPQDGGPIGAAPNL